MSEILWESRQKARHEHFCDFCCQWIAPGNTYVRWLWRPGGRTFLVMRRHSMPGCELDQFQVDAEKEMLAVPITYQVVMKQVQVVLRNGSTVTENRAEIVPVLAPAELLMDGCDENEEAPF